MKKFSRILFSVFLLCALAFSLCACSLSAVARDLGEYWLYVPEPAAPAETPTEPAPTEDTATESPTTGRPSTESPTAASIAGEYTIHSISMDGFTVDESMLSMVLKEYNMESRELLCLVLYSDGTGLLTATDPDTGEKIEAELGWDSQWLWPLEDPTDLAGYTYRDDQISMTGDGVTMVLQKTVLSV